MVVTMIAALAGTVDRNINRDTVLSCHVPRETLSQRPALRFAQFMRQGKFQLCREPAILSGRRLLNGVP